MTEFKAYSFAKPKTQAKPSAFRDLSIDDLLGEKSSENVQANEALILAEREKKVAMAEQRVAELMALLENAVKSWTEKEKKLLEDARRSAVKFALAVAERIIDVKVEMDVEVLTKAIEKLQHLADDHERAVLRVNPSDADALRAIGQHKGIEGNAVRMESDETVHRGCARLDTEYSLYEVDYRRQLTELAEFYSAAGVNNSEPKVGEQKESQTEELK